MGEKRVRQGTATTVVGIFPNDASVIARSEHFSSSRSDERLLTRGCLSQESIAGPRENQDDENESEVAALEG